MLKKIFSLFSSKINPYDTELIKACIENDFERANNILLIDKKVDVNAYSYLALIICIRNKNFTIMDLLLQNGGDIDTGGSNSLFLEAEDGETVLNILQRGADSGGMIYHFIAKDNLDCVRAFLEYGEKIKRIPKHLYDAIITKASPEMLELLKEQTSKDGSPLNNSERVTLILALTF